MNTLPWFEWHHAQWLSLGEQRRQERMPHALMLLGPRGVGREGFALALACSLICAQPKADGRGCGDCGECRLSAAGTHPDLHRYGLEPDSQQIKVAQIRQLSHQANLTPSRAPRQVFVLAPADRMNVNAANALLKTLEEPPGDSILILVTHSGHRLPATVLSRCQKLVLNLPLAEAALAWLREQYDLSAEEAGEALQAASGSPGLAAQLLSEDGVQHHQAVSKALVQLADGQLDPVELAQLWQDPWLAQRLGWLTGCLRHLAWQLAGHPISPTAEPHGCGGELQGRVDLARLCAYASEVDLARARLSTSLRPELVTEDILIGWCQLAQ